MAYPFFQLGFFNWCAFVKFFFNKNVQSASQKINNHDGGFKACWEMSGQIWALLEWLMSLERKTCSKFVVHTERIYYWELKIPANPQIQKRLISRSFMFSHWRLFIFCFILYPNGRCSAQLNAVWRVWGTLSCSLEHCFSCIACAKCFPPLKILCVSHRFKIYSRW